MQDSAVKMQQTIILQLGNETGCTPMRLNGDNKRGGKTKASREEDSDHFIASAFDKVNSFISFNGGCQCLMDLQGNFFYSVSVVLKYCLCFVTYMNVYVTSCQNKDFTQQARMEEFYSRSSSRFK